VLQREGDNIYVYAAKSTQIFQRSRILSCSLPRATPFHAGRQPLHKVSLHAHLFFNVVLLLPVPHRCLCCRSTKTGRTRKLSNKQVVSASGGARSLQWNDQPSAAGKLLYANFTHRSRQGMLRAAFFCCYDRHGKLDMLRCVQKDSSNGRIRIMFVEQPPCSTLFGIAPAHFNCSVMV
jgi:hypothetical protein